MNQASLAQPGLLLIVSGPSGVGKTTITHHIERQLNAVFSISMTTRPRAVGDKHGEDYYFVSDEQFAQHRDAGELLEWAQVFGHCYGTPRKLVEDNLQQGKIVLLEIDVHGAVQVKRAMPESFALFVLPPSEKTLLDRLRSRRREDEAAIQRRFALATDEIAQARASGVYDLFIVNDDLDDAVRQAVEAVRRKIGD